MVRHAAPTLDDEVELPGDRAVLILGLAHVLVALADVFQLQCVGPVAHCLDAILVDGPEHLRHRVTLSRAVDLRRATLHRRDSRGRCGLRLYELRRTFASLCAIHSQSRMMSGQCAHSLTHSFTHSLVRTLFKVITESGLFVVHKFDWEGERWRRLPTVTKMVLRKGHSAVSTDVVEVSAHRWVR